MEEYLTEYNIQLEVKLILNVVRNPDFNFRGYLLL